MNMKHKIGDLLYRLTVSNSVISIDFLNKFITEDDESVVIKDSSSKIDIILKSNIDNNGHYYFDKNKLCDKIDKLIVDNHSQTTVLLWYGSSVIRDCTSDYRNLNI